MGVQEISERKTRQAAIGTGLPLFRCLRHSNRLWFGFVRGRDDGHWHVDIDPSTWEWRVAKGCGFSSCSEGMWGPRVAPPAGMALMTWLSSELAQAEKMIEWMKSTLDFYANEANYDTQPDWAAIAGQSLKSHVPIQDDRGALARAAVAAIEEDQ